MGPSAARVARAIRELYGVASEADIEPLAEPWHPYRSWICTLLRVDAVCRPAEVTRPETSRPGA